MKKYLLFLLFYSVCFYPQDIPNERVVDSASYFLELARFNRSINNYGGALLFTQKAIDFAKREDDSKTQANAWLSLATLYTEIQKYDDALEAASVTINLFNRKEPTSELAYAYYTLGLCYMEKSAYTKAENNFDRAKKIYQTINLPDAIVLLDLQKGILYKAKGENDKAYSIFNGIIALTDKNDYYRLKAEANYHIGTIEIGRMRYNLALNYLDRALEINQELGNISLKSKIYKSLAETYEGMREISLAHKFYKMHVELKDSIAALNEEKLDAGDYARFKEGERLKTIEQLNKENQQKEKASKFAKLISILAIALISILSLLSLSLYKNNIIRNQSNALLKEKNKELHLAKEKAEKASKARSEFLSTVSHELRTPLNAINGITHLLIEENPKESQLKYLTSLKFSGDYLLTFINEILEINRIESSNVVAESINFNLKILLQNIQDALNELAAKNNNVFTIDIDQNIPDILIGDPTKLSQVFMNLINNALKFTRDGHVNVIAKSTKVDDEITTILFKVEDNGIGIPEDKQQTVFDSFAQGSIEINRKYGGTGLGLNIVKKLVEILGGAIHLESKIGSGSTFSFELNFKVSSGMLEENNANYDESIFINKKILLVEDNKINQMITKRMLENKQMLCEIIDNGEDAIIAVKNNYFDLVLMDVHLPGINGTIATEQIRAFDKQTRIIALTAISLNENREMLLGYGMNDVLTKPFDPADFYRIIAQHLVS